jgi:hypothetical protein
MISHRDSDLRSSKLIGIRVKILNQRTLPVPKYAIIEGCESKDGPIAL